MVYDLSQIAEYVRPIAEKYSIPAVYVFGSYATNTASENSDIDFLIDRKGSKVKNLFDLSGLCMDIENTLGKSVDVMTVQQLETDRAKERIPHMVEAIGRERVQIYGQ